MFTQPGRTEWVHLVQNLAESIKRVNTKSARPFSVSHHTAAPQSLGSYSDICCTQQLRTDIEAGVWDWVAFDDHVHLALPYWKCCPTYKCWFTEFANRFRLRFKWCAIRDWAAVYKYVSAKSPARHILCITEGFDFSRAEGEMASRTDNPVSCRWECEQENTDPNRSSSSREGRPEFPGTSEDREDVCQPVQPIPRNQGKGRAKAQWRAELRQSVQEIQPESLLTYKRAVADSPFAEFYRKSLHIHKFDEELQIEINDFKMRNQRMKWWDILEELKPEYLNIDNMQKVEDTVYWLKQWILHNGFDINEFIDTMITWVDKTEDKKNLVEFEGAPNCGKSWVINSIAWSLRVVFRNNMLDKNQGQFALQEMIMTRIAFLDECKITSDFYEKYLLIAAGMPCATDRKNNGFEVVPRQPLAMAYNFPPIKALPSQMHNTALAATRARTLLHINCKPYDEFKHCKGQPNPLAWKYLIAERKWGRDGIAPFGPSVNYPYTIVRDEPCPSTSDCGPSECSQPLWNAEEYADLVTFDLEPYLGEGGRETRTGKVLVILYGRLVL